MQQIHICMHWSKNITTERIVIFYFLFNYAHTGYHTYADAFCQALYLNHEVCQTQ